MPPATKQTVPAAKAAGRSQLMPPGGAKAAASNQRPTSAASASSSASKRPASTPTTTKKKTSTDATKKATIEEPMLAAVDLFAQAEAKNKEAEACEKDTQVGQATLELQIGRALSKEKQNVPDLMRSWDKNKDGLIQKIELRQVVRNHLKIKADNAAIDAVYDKLDVDKSETIDIKELTSALDIFKAECIADDAKSELAQEAAKAMRADAAVILQAAEATRTYEELRARARGEGAGTSEPVERQLASAIIKGGAGIDMKQTVHRCAFLSAACRRCVAPFRGPRLTPVFALRATDSESAGRPILGVGDHRVVPHVGQRSAGE